LAYPQGHAGGQGDDHSGGGRAQQGKDDTTAQQEKQNKRTGQHGELPWVGQRTGQRDGGAAP
jgi:hypothetical protein